VTASICGPYRQRFGGGHSNGTGDGSASEGWSSTGDGSVSGGWPGSATSDRMDEGEADNGDDEHENTKDAGGSPLRGLEFSSVFTPPRSPASAAYRSVSPTRSVAATAATALSWANDGDRTATLPRAGFIGVTGGAEWPFDNTVPSTVPALAAAATAAAAPGAERSMCPKEKAFRIAKGVCEVRA